MRILTINRLPDMRLSMNGRNRLSWHQRSELVAEERRYAWALALAQEDKPPIDPAEVRLLFCVTTYRRRDPDGLQSAAKAWLDGLVDAGWLKDDSFPHVRRIVTEVQHGKRPSTVIAIGTWEPSD